MAARGRKHRQLHEIRQQYWFSVGDIARLTGICRNVIRKWCDKGSLQHCRTSNAGPRMVGKVHLINFLSCHALPDPFTTE